MTQAEHEEAVLRLRAIDDRLVALERIEASGPLVRKEKNERAALRSERKQLLAAYRESKSSEGKR